MASRPRWRLAAAIGLALIAVPVVLKLASNNTEGVASAPGPPEKLRVTAHRVQPVHLEERLQTTGTIRANEEVELVSEISGTIAAIHFEEGSRVSRGQLLLEIDDSELTAERQRALYRLDLAKRAEARQQQLLDDGVISSERYDVARGELNVLRAELQLIEAQLEKTEIRAPFGGVIGLRWVSPGAYLSSQTTIAVLRDLDPVKVEYSVPERYASLVEAGDEITFTIEGNDHTFEGVVYAVEPGVDPDSRSLRMRARSANPEGLLRPGTFANIDLAVRSVADALAVPAIAIIPELGGTKVWVLEAGRAESRSVTTGIRTKNLVQVTEGLDGGELVITSGLLQLQPGLEVEMIDSRTDAAALS